MYCMSMKSWAWSYSKLLHKMGPDFFAIQYILSTYSAACLVLFTFIIDRMSYNFFLHIKMRHLRIYGMEALFYYHLYPLPSHSAACLCILHIYHGFLTLYFPYAFILSESDTSGFTAWRPCFTIIYILYPHILLHTSVFFTFIMVS